MKVKSQQLPSKTLRATVLYGYALFAAFVLMEAVYIVRTVPMMLNGLHGGGYSRVIALFVGLVGSVLLPPLIAFFIGYFATSKNAAPYHRQFNGVALGLCALWLSYALSTAMYRVYIPQPSFIPLQVFQFGYALVATFIILALGISYMLTKKKALLPQYKPFSFILVGSLLAWFIFLLTGGPGGLSSFAATASISTLDLVQGILEIVSIPIIFALSYYFSPFKASSTVSKISLAAILTTLFLSTVLATGMLSDATVGYLDNFQTVKLLALIGYPVALVIWASYVYVIKKDSMNISV